METFPAFIPLAGRIVVVAGAGEAADAKARLFAGSPARLVRLGEAEAIASEAYQGAVLAFIAGPEPFATAAAAAARRAGALVNVVDRPGLGDFQTPSIIDRGLVVGAIGTGGSAPVLATELRNALEASWPEGLDRLADMLRRLQPEIRARLPDLTARRGFLRRLLASPAASAALEGDLDHGLALARGQLDDPEPQPGRLWLLTAPETTDRLTLGALRLLGRADRIIAEPGRHEPLLALARRDATRAAPGDAPADRLSAWVAAGETLVVIAGPGERLDQVALAERAGAAVDRSLFS